MTTTGTYDHEVRVNQFARELLKLRCGETLTTDAASITRRPSSGRRLTPTWEVSVAGHQFNVARINDAARAALGES